jgi:hypothetical protein
VNDELEMMWKEENLENLRLYPRILITGLRKLRDVSVGQDGYKSRRTKKEVTLAYFKTCLF